MLPFPSKRGFRGRTYSLASSHSWWVTRRRLTKERAGAEGEMKVQR